MSTGLLSLLVTGFLLLLLIQNLTYQNKDKLSPMSGMVIAMGLGMIVGLFSGTILGIAFKGNLFLSSFIGIGIGVILGGIVGSFFSIVAFLDGILSGLMGGMMGAMLGEMVLPLYHEATAKLLFIFYLAIVFTLIYLVLNEVKEVNLFTKLFKNPFVMLVIFTLLITVSFLFGPIWNKETEENIHEHHSFELIIIYT
jgi:MFS family permease